MENEFRRSWSTKAAGRWVVVFLMNVPMPLYLASMLFNSQLLTEKIAFYSGMAAACLMLLAIGFYFVGKDYLIAKTMTHGGVILSLTQFIPIIQFIVGLIAVGVWNNLVRGREKDAGFRFLEGYTMTFFTGQGLLICALILGLLFKDPLRWASTVRTWKR